MRQKWSRFHIWYAYPWKCRLNDVFWNAVAFQLHKPEFRKRMNKISAEVGLIDLGTILEMVKVQCCNCHTDLAVYSSGHKAFWSSTAKSKSEVTFRRTQKHLLKFPSVHRREINKQIRQVCSRNDFQMKLAVDIEIRRRLWLNWHAVRTDLGSW